MREVYSKDCAPRVKVEEREGTTPPPILPEQELTWSVVGGGNLKIPKVAACFHCPIKWKAHWPDDTRVGSALSPG